MPVNLARPVRLQFVDACIFITGRLTTVCLKSFFLNLFIIFFFFCGFFFFFIFFLPATRDGVSDLRGEGEKIKGNVLFNDTLNTFFIYGYMASDMW